jgi:hypothetical protein
MPIVPQNNFPSLNTIANLARSIVDDDKAGATGTPGEGQILTNTSVQLQNFMNSAIRDLWRDTRIMGQPSLIKDNVLVYGIPPVNSPYGVGTPNPAIQTSLTFTGFFDGLEMWGNYTLPSDLIYPLEVWGRQNGSQNSFTKIKQSTGPLPSVIQTSYLNEWEWRTDQIWFQGATVLYDLRLRYYAKYLDLATVGINWSTTYVPIMDCEEALADKISVRYAQRLGGDALADARVTAAASLLKLRQQITRDRQKIDYRFGAYADGQGGNQFEGLLY